MFQYQCLQFILGILVAEFLLMIAFGFMDPFEVLQNFEIENCHSTFAVLMQSLLCGYVKKNNQKGYEVTELFSFRCEIREI